MPHNSKKLEIKPLSKGSAGMDEDFDVPLPLPNKPFMMTITGERGSGKSVCIQNLIQIYKPIMDYIVIMSPSVFKNDDYDFIKEDPVYTSPIVEDGDVFQTVFKYDNIGDFPSIIQNIIDKNTQIILKESRAEAPNILIVLDDILEQGGKLTSSRGNVIETISYNGRHSKISCIVASQLFKRISNGIRSNCDISIVYSATNLQEVEKYLDEFCTNDLKKEVRKKLSKVFDIPYTFVCMLGKQIANRMKLKRSERLYYMFDKPLMSCDFGDDDVSRADLAKRDEI